ncbi:flagellar biosynthesis regulator FlaF [Magnetospirillum sp. UT-4]|uniref:flagellar biosynthesis regulator FlaF n=1 Tax=Magnetospirillum sp. UT-4 TaxID=2681467 RepID=UPI00137EB5C8|nr:flagellar biosynthesis regulator FlaF [Magnetospirillum sp. UT-4]CAA7627140.1 putative flagellar protein FlaF [Magnetospirillum sp. UT-4]
MPRRPVSPYLAYDRSQRSALPPRQAEALAFTRVANALEECCREPVDRRRLEAVLRRNQTLWTVVEGEIALTDNRLPEALKANLARLARSVEHLTLRAMASGAPADLRPLIDIDRQVAAGLME